MIFDTTITPAAPRMSSVPMFVPATVAGTSWRRASRPEQVSGLRGNARSGFRAGTTQGSAHIAPRSAVLPTPIVDARNATKQDRPPRGIPR